jgi:hypothetical protein
MADKLSIYSRALYHLGERKLSSLTENREPRRALDDHWSSGVGYCLEAALWNFAIRAVEVASSPSVTPTFGFTFAFAKPEDWLRTASLSDNERFDPPLTYYRDEVGYWWADVDPLYVTYVSNDTSYGLDLSRWPESFSEYVSVHLARKIVKRITNGNSEHADLRKEEAQCKLTAVSRDAMNDPVKFMPLGTWTRARRAGSSRPFRRANSIVG